MSQKYIEVIKTLNKSSEISDYYSAFNKLQKLNLSSAFPDSQKIKISILSSFTSEPLVYYIFIKCLESNIFPLIFNAPYRQFNQQIKDTKSQLYDFKPEVSLILTDIKSYTNIFDHNFYLVEERLKKEAMEGVIESIRSLFQFFKNQSDSLIIFGNFIAPAYTPYGIIDNKNQIGIKEFINCVNLKLMNLVKADNQIFIMDLENIASSVGKDNIYDKKLYYMSDIPFTGKFLGKLSEECMRYIKAFKGLTKKCIVLDLDNTLWGGIVGEDGPENIKLGRDFPGNCYRDFQKHLLELHNRGIVLAINSKNNFEDAMKVIENHPEMILRKEHFASIKINWNDKASNLEQIAQEINLGLDSFIFIDDNSAECLLVSSRFPMVKVICLPQDSTRYCEVLKLEQEFDFLFITKEDISRNLSYKQNSFRNELMKTSKNYNDYLINLKMKLFVKEINQFNIQRIVQLINKTNQFNCTTKRYALHDINNMLTNKSFLLRCFQLIDQFGDNGIISVLIAKLNDLERGIEIDTFLMSCRVLGRNLESAIFYYLYELAKINAYTCIKGSIVFTKKNEPVRQLYKNHNFELIKNDINSTHWRFNLEERELKRIEYIDVIDEVEK